MNQSISETEILERFLKNKESGISLKGTWRFKIVRADGTIEEHVSENIVTKDGLNAIAELMLGDATGANSGFRYIAIGTVVNAGSLGSVQSGLGEVGRKIASTIASSNETGILVATWAGNADSITGVALRSAGMVNHASSGSGIFGSHVNSVSATLNDSDFLQVQVEVQVGSHNL